MRLAGIIKQYSKNAIPQLAKIVMAIGSDLNFKCPYHANVIKMFDNVSKNIGKIIGIPIILDMRF